MLMTFIAAAKAIWGFLVDLTKTKSGLWLLLIVTNIGWYFYYTDNPRIKPITRFVDRYNDIITILPPDTVEITKVKFVERLVESIRIVEVVPKLIERRLIDPELISPAIEVGEIKIDQIAGLIEVEIISGDESFLYTTELPAWGEVVIKPVDSTGFVVQQPRFGLISTIDGGINSEGNPLIGVSLLHSNLLIQNIRLGLLYDFEAKRIGIGLHKMVYPRRTNISIGLGYFFSQLGVPPAMVFDLSFSVTLIKRLIW